MTLLIKNGNFIDVKTKTISKKDILIKDGKINEISNKINANANEIIDAKDLYVSPGFIDLHTHLREPGFEYKETIKTGSLAAVRGGFTSVCCMANTNPVNDNASVTQYIIKKASEEAVCNVFPIGAITRELKGEDLAEIGDMKNAGIVAISDDGKSVENSLVLRRAMEYAKGFDLPIISHAEDPKLVSNGLANESLTSITLGLAPIPHIAEEIFIMRDIMLAEYTGSRLHIAHVSTKRSLELIKEAKIRGSLVTCEVTPHHFTLTEDELKTYNTNFKVNPPLRSKLDIEALKQGLKEGIIDAIATDHAPHASHEKEIEFEYAKNGIIGLETAFSLGLNLVKENVLTLISLIEKLTINPAKIINIDRGILEPNKYADITIFDDKIKRIINKNEFYSLSRNTPFDGLPVSGDIIYTIVGGQLVYNGRK
jgi:dihydroorotase